MAHQLVAHPLGDSAITITFGSERSADLLRHVPGAEPFERQRKRAAGLEPHLGAG